MLRIRCWAWVSAWARLSLPCLDACGPCHAVRRAASLPTYAVAAAVGLTAGGDESRCGVHEIAVGWSGDDSQAPSTRGEPQRG